MWVETAAWFEWLLIANNWLTVKTDYYIKITDLFYSMKTPLTQLRIECNWDWLHFFFFLGMWSCIALYLNILENMLCDKERFRKGAGAA